MFRQITSSQNLNILKFSCIIINLIFIQISAILALLNFLLLIRLYPFRFFLQINISITIFSRRRTSIQRQIIRINIRRFIQFKVLFLFTLHSFLNRFLLRFRNSRNLIFSKHIENLFNSGLFDIIRS